MGDGGGGIGFGGAWRVKGLELRTGSILASPKWTPSSFFFLVCFGPVYADGGNEEMSVQEDEGGHWDTKAGRCRRGLVPQLGEVGGGIEFERALISQSMVFRGAASSQYR